MLKIFSELLPNVREATIYKAIRTLFVTDLAYVNGYMEIWWIKI